CRFATSRLLPDHGEELAAQVGAPRLAVGHQTLGGRDDRHAEAVLDARQLAALDVAPEAGSRDAPKLADDRELVVILQIQPQHAVRAVTEDLVVRDVMVAPQQPGHLGLQLAHRHVDTPMARRTGVPDAGEHIRDGIYQAHSLVPLTSWPCARPGFPP